ncbi:MAG: AtuA-related protein [Thermoanaerobaculum sp.]
MPRVPLETIALGRSGDKGSASNVGLIARSREAYEWMRANVTPEWVKRVFKDVVRGEVVRYEVPNLLALNFILHDSLGGGGSESLLTDAQGKTHAQGLLRVEVEIPESVLASVGQDAR